MHWYGQCRAAFFAAWSDAGLPDPEAHLDRYLNAGRSANGKLDPPPIGPDALDGNLIRRVYGFGAVIGEALGRLAGLEPAAAISRAGWCGRFNLGISLFDYVCDEAGRAEVLASVEPFARFEGAAMSVPAPPLEPVEAYLVSLASDLLEEFEAGAADRLEWQPLFKSLYHAERAVAEWELDPAADLKLVRTALEDKSAEPFALMAAWTALAKPDTDILGALRIGRALGHCFWFIDDACDLWADLDSGMWNLFLVHAASLEPRLLTNPRTALRDIHLSRLLEQSGAAASESRSAVLALTHALASAQLERREEESCLGSIAAALASWS